MFANGGDHEDGEEAGMCGAHGVGVEADVGGGGQQMCCQGDLRGVAAGGPALRRSFRCKEVL